LHILRGAVLASLLVAAAAGAVDLVTAPISHAAGFQLVVCDLVNGHPTKSLVVESFDMEDVENGAVYSTSKGGPCAGTPPWTVPPLRGCSAQLITISVCTSPNGCFCFARVKGSRKFVRGRLTGTVAGSTIAITAELE
jgi:hypothetical protein